MIPSIDIKKIFRLKETSIPESSLWLFGGLSLVVLLSVLLAISLDELLLLAIPAGLLLVYQTVVDYKKVFYLFLFSIPLSTEYYFPNGLSTDLPTEPLLVGLMMAYGLSVLVGWQSKKRDFLSHPITLFLIVHLAWILLTMMTSANFIVSFKFVLAKIWYVVVCYFLAASIFKTEKDIKKFFWVIFIPFIIIVFITLYRQSTYAFSFEDVKYAMQPCFRNHVSYAAILAVFLPFILMARKWYKANNLIYWGLIASAIVFVLAVYLSYTRTAYISLVIAWGSYFLIRLRLMKIVSLLSVIIIFIGIFKIMNDNEYLKYAPDFESTISHTDFDDLVNATAQGQDVSTMERMYRWIAGMQMSKESKLVGYGPGNFHDFYKPYAVTSFETYVSDNPEKSGINFC